MLTMVCLRCDVQVEMLPTVRWSSALMAPARQLVW